MGARGEATLRVDETEYHILFTNRAIAQAEAAMGRSVITVVRDPGVADVAKLLAAGLEAARRESKSRGLFYSVNDAYRLMDEVGFAQATEVMLTAVGTVLAYKGEGEETEGAESDAESPNP